MTNRSLVFLAMLTATISTARSADEKRVEFPAVSQHAVVKQRVGLTDFEIEYSRPNKNKRQIFGELVPFNKVWRTGANAPTRIKISDAVTVNEKPLPAGEYVLVTVPGEKQWVIAFSKDVKLQSVADYNPANDAIRVEVAPRTLPAPVETFTIGFDDLRVDAAMMYFDWDTTRVPVSVKTNAIATVTQQIDDVSKSGKEQEAGFYYNAASFYFDQNKDLTQAAKWIDQAIAKSPQASFMFYKKAQIEMKLGHKAEAIAAAEKSNEILKAQPKPDEAALRNNQQLIESLR